MKLVIHPTLTLLLFLISNQCISQVQDSWVSTLGFFGNSTSSPGLVLDGNKNIIAGVNASDFAPGETMGLVRIFTLSKYTPTGTLVFDIVESAQPYGKNLVDMAVDNAGNIYCAVSETRSLGPSRSGALFAVYKYSPTGGVIWKRSYGQGDFSQPRAIAVDATGSVYLTGQNKFDNQQLSGELPDYLTVKWNSAGDLQWARKYDGASPGEGSNIANDIIVDGSGNLFITGESQKDGEVGYATIKYTSAGTELWAVRYNGLNSTKDIALALTRDVNGFIYVTGSSEGAIATLKYNNDGAQIWVQREGTSGAEGKAIKVDGSGNVFVAGDGSGTQMILLKLNFAGTKQWATLRSGTGYALDIDGLGNSYISGTINNDASVIKLNGSGVQQWIKTHDSPLRPGIMNPVVVDNLQNVYTIRFSSFNRDGNANAYYGVSLLKFTQCNIVCPADMTINTSPGECTGVVNYAVSITGECGSNIAYSQPTGTALPVGTTIVAVVDLVSGEHCSFDVTVRDAEAPQVRCKNITIALNSAGNATITAAQIDDKSSDNCGIQSMVLSKTSFTCSDVGTNTVTLSVTDVNGNTAACTATVTVQDNTPPAALCKNATIYLDANGVASISTADIDNGSNDICGSVTLNLSRTAFTCSNKGTNAVVLTATDPNGNSASCAATVTVIDNLPPTISSITASPSNLWPCDRKMKNVTIAASVSDNCTGARWEVTGVETIAGAFDHDNINPDYQIAGDNKLKLRAEPPFGAIYRVYAITITATDAAGNTSTASVNVTVQPDFLTRSAINPESVNTPTVEKDKFGALSVNAYPNPSKNNFTIDVSGTKPGKSIIMQVMDMHGRLLETKNIMSQSAITLGDVYRPGVYIVRIIHGKEHRVIKLMKLNDN